MKVEEKKSGKEREKSWKTEVNQHKKKNAV